MRAPPGRQALLPLPLILFFVFCVWCLLVCSNLYTVVVSVLMSYSDYPCLGATLLRYLVVVLIYYLGAISHQIHLCL